MKPVRMSEIEGKADRLELPYKNKDKLISK